MAKILGIDLGTTNSAMAIMEGGEPRVLENSEGARTTPSVVAIAKNGERLVGTLAKRQAVTNPKNTIYGIKRFMGHRFDDEAVQSDQKVVPYEIKAGPDGGALVHLGEKDYRPEEVSAMILGKLKADAEAKLGEKITEAVITVPAYFDDAQRNATKAAGQVAGLDVKRIINEPTAAALAYGFNKKKDEKIAVYDFGGGTFDVSILEVGDDVVEVKSTDGDAHMGGRDIDQKIVRYLADEFKKESGIDVTKDPLALQRLDEAAEKAKHELSTAAETEVNIPFITSDADGPKHFLIKLSRSTLESLADEYINRSVDITKRALEAAGLKASDINEIVMVGGQTRMPKIQEEVKKIFGKEPNLTVNPDEVVAIGAAIQAGILQGDVKDILLVDVIPLSLSIETAGGVATKLVERNTAIPTSRSQTFSTFADNQTSVEIHVVQGERAMATDNKSLGKFMLDGIPPAPRGLPQVEVTFDLDTNGILTVKAKEKTTGKEQSIRIEGSTGLSTADIEKMRQDAETHAGEDAKRKEIVEAKNLAEQMVYTAEKAVKDNGDKVDAAIVTEVNEKIATLKTAREGDDMEAIKNASEALGTSLSKIGEAMMQAEKVAENTAKEGTSPEENASATDQPGGTPPEAGATDAEFTEKPSE
ncbi:molecular chaperone DnaK [Patescibacteria group bacterium]|nr:molecular chaperone DnaK [Patescibacteria group bacterium]